MTSLAPTVPSRRNASAVVALLAAATFLNYFDRGNLATAGPLVKGDLGLSNAELGVLFSAFFWSYALLQPLAGWLAQRFDVRHVLGTGLILWATATTLAGFATSFYLLLLARVLLGVGESVSYPCNSKFIAQEVPLGARGRANGLVAVGQALGPTCGTLLGGVIMARFGWRPAFIVFGLASALWLIPWRSATREAPAELGGDATTPVSYRRLFRERSLWGTSLGHFCGNYAYYFMLTWLPTVLVRAYGYRLDQMATIGAGVYAMQAVSAPATGALCDLLIKRGYSPTRVLRTTMIVGLCGVAGTMALCTVAQGRSFIALLLAAGAFFGVQSPALGAITQTLAGARAAGRWMGIQNLGANMAGIIAPAVAGLLAGATDQFGWAFGTAAMVTIAGALAYGVVIRRVESIAWDADRSDAAP
jgi:MFS family permease